MSRSYRNRKNNGIAICRDYMKSSGHGKTWKRISNKKMRRMDITNGNMYKKNGYTWDIHDQRSVLHIEKNWHKKINDKNSKYDYKYFMLK